MCAKPNRKCIFYIWTQDQFAKIKFASPDNSGVTTDPADPAMRGGPWA